MRLELKSEVSLATDSGNHCQSARLYQSQRDFQFNKLWVLYEMDANKWEDLCRSCLSPKTNVSIFDEKHNLSEKFHQVTTIKVSLEDRLPHKLCTDCHKTMESAYQFRLQSIMTDAELKEQLKELLKNNELNFRPVNEDSQSADDDDDFGSNPMKQLEAIIKQEPNESDVEDDGDECYYVLVIDDKDKSDSPQPADAQIKIEPPEDSDVPNVIKHTVSDNNVISSTHDFEHSINSFLVNSSKVPDSVPATILENEETQDSEENFDPTMNIDETQTSFSQEGNSTEHETQQLEDSQETHFVNGTIIDTTNLENETLNKNNIFKILSSSNHKTILVKGNDGIEYVTADAQILTEDGKDGDTEEVIFYDCEEDSSQLSVLKYDGSELVIEYSDDGQIATVIQQEDGSFLCDCGEVCADLTEYEQHQSKHNSSTTVDNLCNMCGKGFESHEILTGHKLLHTVTGLLVQCPFCDQLIKRNILTQHIKISHNNIKPYCSVCGKTFANSNNLKRHMMIHSGIRDFECDICKKRFHQKITMQTHRFTHINPSSFTCTQCDQSFQSNEELTSHQESGECSKSKVIKVKEELMKTVKQLVTTNVGKVLGYACSLCKKMFSVESALEQHIESSHLLDPNELICADCGEVMPSKREMQSHMLAHKTARMKNAKRFQCNSCGKGCSSQAMLLMHERVHTNERPFPCQLCALRFKTKTHLRTHQLTHTREKKFGCPVCRKFFALKGNLVVHLRTHTGERPYVCVVCNEAFIDSKYLKKHKLKKHGIASASYNQEGQASSTADE